MYVLVFILGAVIGSFLNVCSMRIPEDRSIIHPPSHCDSCQTRLKWFDLIPILSYIFYRGKCRYCGVKLSIQYPLVEFLNGALFVVFFYKFGLTLEFIIFSLVSSTLLVIAIIDFNTQLIPDILIIVLVILAIIYRIALIVAGGIILPVVKDGFFGLLLGGGVFFLIYFLSRGGMGEGDILLIAALGLLVGLKNTLLLMFMSFVTGAAISVFLLAFKIKSRKDAIPFGPFIVLSFYITVFLEII